MRSALETSWGTPGASRIAPQSKLRLQDKEHLKTLENSSVFLFDIPAIDSTEPLASPLLLLKLQIAPG
jgi:hypothetical protein